MPNHFIKEIISGGQTGVDRAALDVSLELNIPHSGWCPYGRKAEDGIIPAKYNLKEAPAPTFDECSDPDAIYKKRTELNAKDSDGTLIILQDEPTGGTLYTIQMAQKHKKPYLIFKLSDNFQMADIVNWVIKNNIHRLNIAGPRASQVPNIYNAAHIVLHRILSHALFPTKRHEKALYECALAVEKDEALKSDLAAWNITIEDGLKDKPFKPRKDKK